MTEETHDIQKQQQAEIQKRLWAIANDLRGNMDPSEFKNYILGFIFYRFLSNKVENYVNKLLKNDGISYEEAWEDEEFQGELKDALIKDIGYLIEPEYLFSNFIKKINVGVGQLELAPPEGVHPNGGVVPDRGVVEDELPAHEGDVIGGGEMARRGQAGAVDKAGVRHAQLGGPLVHFGHEGLLAAAQVLGQGHRGVVA